MRKALKVVAICATCGSFPQGACASSYFDDATNNQIIEVWGTLEGICRGGGDGNIGQSGDLTFAWCGARDLLDDFMRSKRNLCFGKKGDVATAQKFWHTCQKDSLR